jgi:hypothetical protein
MDLDKPHGIEGYDGDGDFNIPSDSRSRKLQRDFHSTRQQPEPENPYSNRFADRSHFNPERGYGGMLPDGDKDFDIG